LCGIAGFVGKSTDPRVSFDLANALFLKTETRGEHASGFWACEEGNGGVFYDKEPVKSSVYINREIWKDQFSSSPSDLLLMHCRLSSLGVGHEKYNKNNHPHVSEDNRVALVHNGKIPEYTSLRNRYETNSDCDSEILLRIFESANEYKNKEDYLAQEFPSLTSDIAYRLLGMKEIFARVNYGAMAVAIGERGDDGSRYLWLFRDDERPLHVVDMRKTLGQIFFCSTAEIWRAAVEATPSAKSYTPNDQVIIEVPPLQIWLLSLNSANEEKSWLVKKFKISKTKLYSDFQKEDEEDERKRYKKENGKDPITIVSRLNKDEEVTVVKSSSDSSPRDKHLVLLQGGKHQCCASESSIIPQLPPLEEKKKTKPYAFTTEDFEEFVPDEREYLSRQIAMGRSDAKVLTEFESSNSELDMDQYNHLMDELTETTKNVDIGLRQLVNIDKMDKIKFELVLESLRTANTELSATLILLKNEH
jgi:predicted glutamine amidotransferase